MRIAVSLKRARWLYPNGYEEETWTEYVDAENFLAAAKRIESQYCYAYVTGYRTVKPEEEEPENREIVVHAFEDPTLEFRDIRRRAP